MDALLGLHLLTLSSWLVFMAGARARLVARPTGEAWRRAEVWLAGEHGSFIVALLAGYFLARRLGWGLGHAGWYALKLGLVAGLVAPLEAVHFYAWRFFLTPAQRSGASRDLERGFSMQEMIRALQAVLLGAAVPLLVWLSVWKPF